MNDLNSSAFKSFFVLFLKSLKLQAPFNPKQVLCLDIDLLQNIIHQREKLRVQVVSKPLYFVAFFSFMRLSNLLPYLLPHPLLTILGSWPGGCYFWAASGCTGINMV